MSGSGRILVIRGGAIGDFILTLPVLSALRRAFPAVHLEVLGYPHIAGLAAAGGLADAVQALESPGLAGFFGRSGRLDTGWSDYFAGFHQVISFLFDPDGQFATNLGRVTGARHLAGRHRPSDALDRHATDQLLEVLEGLALFDADPVPRLRMRGMERFPATGRGDGAGGGIDWLAVHPGSGSPAKNWPEPCWRELLERIGGDTDWGVRLIGGEAEGGRLERLATVLPPGRISIWRSRPLPELAAWMAGCRGFIGLDSGISHLGAAVGLPGLVLWGPTREAVWRPRSDRVTTVRHADGLEGLPVGVVWARLRDSWAAWAQDAPG